MMHGWKNSACFVLLITSLSACGQASKSTSSYVKATGWTSICLARIGLNLPDSVLVADPGAAHPNGGGFEGIAGTFTASPLINKISIEETGPTTLQTFEEFRDLASFNNRNGRIIKYAAAPTGSKFAYAFHSRHGGFRVGYFDPSDTRIRTFVGGLPVNKPEGEYTVEDLSAYYQELRHLYTARKPTDLPTQPGICTPYGFFKEPTSGPVSNYNIDIAVRSLKYPSLIIFVHIRPPEPNAPKTLEELRDPNNITADDLKSIKGMGAIAAIAALGNIKKMHEPQKITIAGQPGRLSAREYHHKGTLDTAGSLSGAAYEIQADAVGVQGKPDMPAITIKLAAALPDPFPYPPPVRRMSFGEEKIDYYKPARPVLKGVKTPPFDEAMAYFKQVLASVRPLPQLHGQAPGNSPTVPASAASR